MLSLNAFVLMRLRRSRNRVITVSFHSSEVQRRLNGQLTKREIRFIVSTITIDFTFFLFYTPLAAFFGISIGNLFNSSLWAPLTSTFINLFSNVSQLLAFGHSVALIFIFAACNRYFRLELANLLGFSRFLRDQTSATAGSKTN